ncbi:unnamed protein product, partial [Oppiella nova]
MCEKTTKVNYIVRELQLSDCREVHEIWASVGWSRHIHESQVIMNIDPNGQYVAQDIDTGKLLGNMCGVNITDDLAYIGSYCVRPEYQGRGIGKALWDKTIEHLGDRNLGLVSSEQNTFEFYRDVRNFRYISDRFAIIMRGSLTPNPQLVDNIDGISLVTIDGHNVRDVIEYDKHVSGLDRTIDDHGHVVGYCFILETYSGMYSVEPLYADNERIAELLVGKCVARLPPNQRLKYRCWTSSEKSQMIGTKLGLSEIVRMWTMYTKKLVDPAHIDKAFCPAMREMQLSDCREVRDLWNSAGFPIHKYRPEVIINIDPVGQYVAQDTDTGKLLGYLAGVNVSDDLAYIGGYCVRPEYRGRGIGKAIWVKTGEHMGDRNLGLTTHKQNTFEYYRDVYNFRCISDTQLIVSSGPLTSNLNLIDNIDGISLVSIDGHNVRDVIEYDKHVSGLDRSLFIEGLYKNTENVNLAAIDDQGHVVGYCFILETCMVDRQQYWLVEPLYADNERIAEYWDNNDKSRAIVNKLGLSEMMRIRTMYTKKLIDPALADKAYCPANIGFYTMCDKNTKVNYIVREMQLSDCREVREIWESVGFPIHKHRSEVIMNIDPNAQYVAQDIDIGKLLGYLSGVNVTEDLAYIGAYAVRPEYQGRGIGKALWAKTIEHMGDRNLGLVSSKQNTFEYYRDVHNFRYISDRRVIIMAGLLTSNPQLIDNIDGISLVTIDGHNVRDVIEYDKHVSGLDRSVLIESLYKLPETINLVANDDQGHVVGYSFLYKTNMGQYLFEPLYADNERIAELLVGKCVARLPPNRRLEYKCWTSSEKAQMIGTKLGLSE